MKAYACLVWLACASGSLWANNLTITNVALVNLSAGEADLQFDVRWDHSWRAAWSDNGDAVSVTNWDAVWLFAKYRQSGGAWKHVILAEGGHAAPAGVALTPSTNCGARLGVFLHREAEGAGTLSAEAVRLRWDYVAGGLQGTNEVDLAVFGIEMVYIPEGPFALGSGGNESGHFYAYPDTNSAYWVLSEEALEVGAAAGRLNYATNYSAYGDGLGPIPAGYPKGCQAFYCMKHEVTQGQYADFLNTLDALAAAHFPDYFGSCRHTVRRSGDLYVADAPDRACNYLLWGDLRDYFDWSGLRPMTELEFEKVCRGVRAPLPNEYVWGTGTWFDYLHGHSGADGSGSETALPSNANVHVSSQVAGPVRAGIFATAASSREHAGAGYYGVLDLAGNVSELVITAGSPQGRAFLDVYGDGSLFTEAPREWGAPGGFSLGLRGGDCFDGQSMGQTFARTSDRYNARTTVQSYSRDFGYGGRGVRRAP